MHNRFLEAYDLPDDHDEATWGTIRRFWWNPSIVEESDTVMLFAGDQMVASFETMSHLRAFVSGMATSSLALPEEVVAELARVLGVEPAWEDAPEWWAGRDLP